MWNRAAKSRPQFSGLEAENCSAEFRGVGKFVSLFGDGGLPHPAPKLPLGVAIKFSTPLRQEVRTPPIFCSF
jgi:hypothetical protein